MAREESFTPGTIVEDEFLNHQQEALTGHQTGIYLAPGSTDAQLTLMPAVDIGGGNLRGQLILANGSDYRVAWHSSSVTNTAYAGGAASVGVYAKTTDAYMGTNGDGTFQLIIAAAQPSDYTRKIGEATASAGNVLSNIRLTNNVYANADQFNNFTFRSVLNSAGEIPLTLRGQSSQNSAASKMLSVGFDTASVYGEKWYLSSLGRIVTTQALVGDYHYQAFVGSDTQPSLVLAGRSILLGPGGSTAPNASIEHAATGVVKVTDTIDVIAIRNSTASGTGGVTGGQAGMVNVNDDLNLVTGGVYRIGGVALASTHLSDTAGLVYLSAGNALTGANTMSNTLTGSGANGYFVRDASSATDVLLRGKISTDTEYRVIADAAGKVLWGLGVTTVGDVSLERTAVGILKVTKAGAATRAALQVSDAPTAGDDLVNKTYADGLAAITAVTQRTHATGDGATCTVLTSDDTIFFNRTGLVTVNLPTAVGVAGKTYTFKDISGAAGTSTNYITIDGNASETIDGATTYTLDTNYEWVIIRSNGANWFVVG